MRTGDAGTGFDGSDLVGTGFVVKAFDGTGSDWTWIGNDLVGRGFVGTGLDGTETGFAGTLIVVSVTVGAQSVGTWNGSGLIGIETGFVGTGGRLDWWFSESLLAVGREKVI